jgi:predicted CXXCH cytochrome family protein
MKKREELKVFISRRESICGECHENLGSGAMILLNRQKGALCLSCADLDHLEFLAPGDSALTRRAKKYSNLYAVILQWSRTRKQYEQQGLLVQKEAIEKAEEECFKDSDLRERRRIRAAEKREELDQEYIQQFAARIRELYQNIPKGRELVIAEHACQKYSGRVGRSATAKAFDKSAVNLAVKAHIRHKMTEYDELLFRGFDRYEARDIVEEKVYDILDKWKG